MWDPVGLEHVIGAEPCTLGSDELIARRGADGVVAHHGPLPPDERTILERVPVTTVPRTLLDLAAVVGRQRVETAPPH